MHGDVPFASIICFGRPQPRSSNAVAAATLSLGSLSAATNVAIAVAVCSRANSSMPFGRPPGLPLWPLTNGRPTPRPSARTADGVLL